MPTLLQEPLVLNPTGKNQCLQNLVKYQGGNHQPNVKNDTRYATQEGDANGVVRGQYAYLDPNYQWQQVSCLIGKHATSVKFTLLWNCCHMQSLLSLFDGPTQLRPIFIFGFVFPVLVDKC